MTSPEQTPLEALVERGWIVPSYSTPRLIMSVSGLKGSGKNHFLYSAPGPIALLDLDVGQEGVVEKFQDTGKEVLYLPVEYTVRNPMESWQWVLYKVQELAYYAKIEGGPRTLGVDTFSELRDLAILAHSSSRGGAATIVASEVTPQMRTKANADIKEIIRHVKNAGMNGVFLQKMRYKWDGARREYTNELETQEWSQMGFEVQVELELYRHPAWQEGWCQYCSPGGVMAAGVNGQNVSHHPEPMEDRIHGQVGKCRQNPGLNGMRIPGRELSFDKVMGLVYGTNR